MMTDEEIGAALHSAGINCAPAFGEVYTGNVQLRAFARAVEAATRERVIEECAKLCEATYPEFIFGKNLQLPYYNTAADCITAIRSLLKPITPKE